MKAIEHDVGADRPPGRRRPRPSLVVSAGGFALVLAIGVALGGVLSNPTPTLTTQAAAETGARAHAPAGVDTALAMEGRHVFRQSTFGDEAFWGDTLQLHQAIEGANGGVGPGVSPKTALAVGPEGRRRRAAGDARRGDQGRARSNLDDPATTLALLKLNAVVGVTGVFDAPAGTLASVGIQCALCHSTVDDSFAPGIGQRLDGWANRDLNVGAIVDLVRRTCSPSPTCSASTRRRCARCCRAGVRASSTPSCSSTARRSGPTASRRRR